ncbi:MAG: hypothetical protein Q7T66_10455 [Herminiimonas sp.]|uniref:hypothetical protein n=1 Tax=Herminiimonas sp. TaxID=1926289 RepID=UPI00271E9CDF|nr:hypothetical protein [Herminiimonas sp.]MDO9421074.1 hypothetical protein [Herminiimonas sp.]
MAIFFVEYDLRKDRNYPKLIEELEKMGGIRILKSLWAIKPVVADLTCQGLASHFRRYIDNDDGLLVSRVTDWSGFNLLRRPPDIN